MTLIGLLRRRLGDGLLFSKDFEAPRLSSRSGTATFGGISFDELEGFGKGSFTLCSKNGMEWLCGANSSEYLVSWTSDLTPCSWSELLMPSRGRVLVSWCMVAYWEPDVLKYAGTGWSLCLVLREPSTWWPEVVMLLLLLPAMSKRLGRRFFLLRIAWRRKYFWAWLATWVGVLVVTKLLEMPLQSPFPSFSSPIRNVLCSSSVHGTPFFLAWTGPRRTSDK